MALTRKYLLDKFEFYTLENFNKHCLAHGQESTLENLLTYLIDQEIIPLTAIKRNTIRKEFDELYPKNEHHKTNTVLSLASRFNISERTVWSILREKK